MMHQRKGMNDGKTTPVQRTLKVLKERGVFHRKVEVTGKYPLPWGKTYDLLNIIDILVLADDFLGIQVCGQDFQSHVKKITIDEVENTLAWLSAGGRIEIWSWRKLKKVRGGKATYWGAKVKTITLADIEPETGQEPTN